MTAINLLRLARETARHIRVVLVDTAASYGRGLAYSTDDDHLVLNVPAVDMSAFPDKPDDFLEFCSGVDAALHSGSFVIRRIYGEYLLTRLSEAGAHNAGSLVEIRDFVTGIQRKDGVFTLTLRSGVPMDADIVVLAFGHFPPRPLAEILGENAFDPDINKDACLDNPWDLRALDRLPVGDGVLIVGTGHTAMDTLLRLVSSPSARRIYMVSRHGHAPNGHREAGEFATIPSLTQEVRNTVRSVLADTPTIRALFSAIRKLVRRHAALGGNWRDVINSLRPVTPEIWRALPRAERARFLRHVAHHWDVLRHRLAPEAKRRLDELIGARRVGILAGRITQLRPAPKGREICATVRFRGTDQRRDLTVGLVINCSGPCYDVRRIGNPLLSQLTDAGFLRQDEMKIGFEVDEDYRCGNLPNLYYIGPMLKGKYWEAIAVPELRGHALSLAKTLMADL